MKLFDQMASIKRNLREETFIDVKCIFEWNMNRECTAFRILLQLFHFFLRGDALMESENVHFTYFTPL